MIGQTAPRHTAEDFVGFLKEVLATCPKDMPVHIILDNLGVHKATL